MYMRNPISLSGNISAENLKGRRVCSDTFQLKKGKNHQEYSIQQITSSELNGK